MATTWRKSIGALLREQVAAPLAEALLDAKRGTEARLCTPGHQRTTLQLPGESLPFLEDLRGMTSLDVSISVSRFGDPFLRSGPLGDACGLYASARGAADCWFSSAGATLCNRIAIEGLLRHGDEVALAVGAHKSIEESVQQVPVTVRYLPTPYSDYLEEPLPPSAGAVRTFLDKHPGIKLVVITSPTYKGFVADIRGISAATRQAGALLLVDSAWGSHFGTASFLPESAIEAGADIVTFSDHKGLMALEQGASLCVNLLPEAAFRGIDAAYRRCLTTSPSFPILGSIDFSRRIAALHGQHLAGERAEWIHGLMKQLQAIKGIRVWEQAPEQELALPAARDPFKIIVDVRGTGLTGHQFAAKLEPDLVVEKATMHTILLLVTLGTTPAALERAAAAIRSVALRHGTGEALPYRPLPCPQPPDMRVQPYEAMNNGFQRVQVPLAQAAGRVAACHVKLYPPGWFVFRPGQLITQELISYVERVLPVANGRVSGLSSCNGDTAISVLDI